jgi:hypothetical protein
MPILIGAVKLMFIWVISSLVAATIAKIAPVAWKGMRRIGTLLTIRKPKLAK